MSSTSLSELFVTQLCQVSALIIFASVVVPWVGKRWSQMSYLLWLLVALKCVTPPVISSPTGVFSWAQAESQTFSPVDLQTGSEVASLRSTSATNLPSEPTPLIAHRPSSGPEINTPVAESSPLRASWVWGCGLWLLGAIPYTCYLCVHWCRTRRMVACGHPPAAELASQYRQVFEASGLSRMPSLVLVDAAFGPAAVGCLRPCIVVPTDVLRDATPSDLKSILAHELAHIRRADVLTSWIQVAASILWWFHPLVWYMNRQIVRWREAACDEEVISRLTISPRSYADAILRVVESRVSPFPALQIGMAVGESTQTRLVRLMTKREFSASTSAWCWLVVLGLAAVLLPGSGMSMPQAVAEAEGGAQNSEELTTFADFVLADEEAMQSVTGQLQLGLNGRASEQTGDSKKQTVVRGSIEIQGVTRAEAPLANVTLTLVRVKGNATTEPIVTRSDANGKFKFPAVPFTVNRSRPRPFERVFLKGETPDGRTMWQSWHVLATDGGRISFSPEQPLVAWTSLHAEDYSRSEGVSRGVVFDLKFLSHVTPVFGVVVNHRGEAVANATVSLVATATAVPPYTQPGVGADGNVVVGMLATSPVTPLPESLQVEVQTDVSGKWRLGSFLKGTALQVACQSGDSPQTTVQFRVAEDKPVRLGIVDAQSTAVTVLHERTRKPVSDVTVRCEQREKRGAFPAVLAEAVTDKTGVAKLALPIGKSVILVAPDAANLQKCYRTTHAVEIDHATTRKTLLIPSGATLEFRVVDDETNEPIPDLPVSVDSASKSPGFEYSTSTADGGLDRGITRYTCRAGSAKFTISSAGYKGYEIVNPMVEPLAIAPRADVKYTFRLRKMKEYRPPVDPDNVADFPAEHQAAVAKLRALGAIVRTVGNTKEGHCDVFLSQFWRGEPGDLQPLRDLKFLKSINCMVYPVPAEYRKPGQLSPLVTDEWLPLIGKASELEYFQVSRSSVTDAGLAHLADCTMLQHVGLRQSHVSGAGLEKLSALPLGDMQITSSTFDLQDVDLTTFDRLRHLRLRSEGDAPIIPPQVGKSLLHLDLSPADERSLKRMETYSGLDFLTIGGPSVTDALLQSSNLWSRLHYLEFRDTKITDAGIAALVVPQLETFSLHGEQFTDAIIPALKRMKNLKMLVLEGTSVSEKGIAEIKAAMPGLMIQARRGPG